MIVVVVRLGENADRGMKFSNELNRPDLIHPKVVKGGPDSDDHRRGYNQRTDSPIEERVGSAQRSQCFSGQYCLQLSESIARC